MGNVAGQMVLSLGLVMVGSVVAALSFGGASVAAAGLISAGISGAVTTITNEAHGKPTSWKDWGVSTAIGAATGLVGGAIGAGAGGFAKGLAEGTKWSVGLAVKGSCIMAGSMASSVACNTIANVCHSRNPFEGSLGALAAGAAGGGFACVGSAAAHLLKHNATSWLAHPFTRHSVGVVVDTAASTTSGFIGAKIAGQDSLQAALVGAATGVAAGAITTAVRGATKRGVRSLQRQERERRVVVTGIEQDGVLFDYEQGPRNSLKGHRDVDHVDRHHSQLKGRFLEPGSQVNESSRFYDLKTADKVRRLARESAVKVINDRGLPEQVVRQRDALMGKIRSLERARTTADLAKVKRAETAVANARQLFERTVATNMRQVDVNVRVPEGCGYGYRNDSSLTRQFNVCDATSHFKAVGQPDGSVVWREISSYPNYQPRSAMDRVMMQRLYAGDRRNRDQVTRNVLVQRHAHRHHEREEEELSVYA